MKKINILWIILLSSILIMCFASFTNAETFGTYPINSNVSLIFSCQNSTYLNISKITAYPQSSILLNVESLTTKQGNVYNYTLLPANNTQIATYIVNYHCDLNGIDTPSVSSYEISNTGYNFSTGDSIIMIIAFVAIGSLVLLFFIFGINNRNLTIKIFCLSMAVLFLIVLFGYGFNIFSTLMGKYPSMTSTLNGIYILLTILLSVGGIGLVIWLIAFSMDLWWKHRGFRD